MTQNNDQVIAVELSNDTVYLRLADGRVIGNPLEWHPWLRSATPEQRANVELYELSAYWPDLDDGLDATEMMKGIPPRLLRKPSTA
jgi:hypothetical protein